MTRTYNAVVRWWRALSAWGGGSGDGARKRTVRGGNHFFAIAVLISLPWVIVLTALAPHATMVPALTHLSMMLVWALCLFLNGHGYTTFASVMSLIAPLAQFLYLTHVFGRDTGFHLNLLAGGAIAFVVFRPTQWTWRLIFVVIGFVSVAWVYADPSFANPAVSVSEPWVRVLVIGNVAQVSLMVYLIAALNSFYFNRERQRNESLLREAQVAAQTDALTGLLNRRGIAPLFAVTARRGDYSIALADIDRFKHINDRLGHGAGDVVLARVARTLVESIGPRGKVARWGGEEFLILMPETDVAKAADVMERARHAVEEEFTGDGVLDAVTMSVGIAHAPRGASREDALRLADTLLYEAKASGRNIVLDGEVTPGVAVDRRGSVGDRRSTPP